MTVKIVRCPTVREKDGLAMSSRNRYLETKEREWATVLYRALSAGAKAMKGGERSAMKVQRVMTGLCKNHPELSIDYLAVCHPLTLEPLKWIERNAVLLGAIRLGKIRLIDNIVCQKTG